DRPAAGAGGHRPAVRVPGRPRKRVVPPDVVRREVVRRAGGDDPIPGPAGNTQGGSMSVLVELSKAGDRDLVVVSSPLRDRQRFLIFTPTGPIAVQGAELSRDRSPCVEVK